MMTIDVSPRRPLGSKDVSMSWKKVTYRDTYVKIGAKEHSLFHIKNRTINSPVVEINIIDIVGLTPSGKKTIDHDIVRVVKNKGVYQLITGYNGVILASKQSNKVNVKLMSRAYFKSTERSLVEIETPVTKNNRARK